MTENSKSIITSAWMPAVKRNGWFKSDGDLVPCPVLLTEAEIIRLLRIPEITKAGDYHNVVENLMRCHDLPCIHISRQPLFPLESVLEWLKEKVQQEANR